MNLDMDLDSALRRLAKQPLHPRLAELEGNVMRLIAERRAVGGMTLRACMLAAVGAVALGVVGGGLSSAAATAQVPTLTPFGPGTPLAPSTLIAFQ